MIGLSLPSFIFEPRGSFAELKMSARLARGRKRKLAETTVADVETKEDTPAVAPFTHWLMKSEPDSRIEKGVEMKFSFEDLKAMPSSTSCWDGVRNYQARNFMREMRTGQLAFFYHSNTKPPGVVGIVEIVREAYPDHTQFDRKDPHFDPGATEVRFPFHCLIVMQSLIYFTVLLCFRINHDGRWWM